MKALRVSVALLFVVLMQLMPSSTYAQVGEPTIVQTDRDGLLGPNRFATYFTEITNTTDTPITVSGVQMIDVLDTSAIEPNRCQRVWFGDAGYRDRPRGEDEQNPPNPPYALPGVTLDAPVELHPGESFAFPGIQLYMIQAAPNACQSRQLTMVYQADWAFQAPTQTYGTVAGTVTNIASEPLSAATVTITGTTDEGVITENLAVDGNGYYASSTSYHTDTELTVTASSDGYTSTSAATTVTEGQNVVDMALEPIPVATGAVSGTVVDTDTGEPIANAMIVLTGTDASGNQASETVYSNTAGQFTSVIQFQAGTSVSMSISAEGYVTTETGIEAVSDGVNTVAPSLTAVQVDEPTQTPSPEPIETETPSPESTETVTPSPEPTETETPEPELAETETPAAEPPMATPVPSDHGASAPPANQQTGPAQPVVSGLPSTGSGGTTSIGLLIGGALASATVIAVAIRRNRH